MRRTLHQNHRRIKSSKNDRRSGSLCFQLAVVATLSGFVCAAWYFSGLSQPSAANNHQHSGNNRRVLKIAFVGNSIIFVHDGPGLLAAMLEATGDYTVTYDACLTGGASLVSLWHEEVGCTPQFSTTRRDGSMTMERLLVGSSKDDPHRQQQEWDYVILNDQSRSPAISYTRRATLRALNQTYAPRLYNAGATPIFLQTAAYRSAVARGPMLGSFADFTQNLAEGYQAYANVFTEYFTTRQQQDTAMINQRRRPTKALVSPVGQAFAVLQGHDPDLFDKLYMDDVHPSTWGTWLQACVLYITLMGQEPPPYTPHFWTLPVTSRRRTAFPIPTLAEGEALRAAAWRTTANK